MSLNAESVDPAAVTNPGMIQLQTDAESEEQELIMSSTVTDFARRLYNLLEDPSHMSAICWGPERDCFTVKDTALFAKTVLPSVFNHSNFASFVRQLNKYDFHKVRRDILQDGDQTWTFQHPNFHGDRPEDLQHIKRKAASGLSLATGVFSGCLPSDKSSTETFSSYPTPPSSQSLSRQSHSSTSDAGFSHSSDRSGASSTGLKLEVDRLKNESEDLRTRTRTLERNFASMGLKLKSVESAVSLRQAQMDNIVHQLMGVAEGQPDVSVNTPVIDSPSLSTRQRQMSEASRHLPPLFTRVPLNIETVGGVDPRSQLGKDQPQASTGYVIPVTEGLSSSKQSADPPGIMPATANLINTYTRPGYLGQGEEGLGLIQARDQDQEHRRRGMGLFDSVSDGGGDRSRLSARSGVHGEGIYFIEDVLEESPIRMPKRPRTAETHEPSGASTSNFPNPNEGWDSHLNTHHFSSLSIPLHRISNKTRASSTNADSSGLGRPRK